MNSIRARAEHVKTWLEAKKPDVLLLQELKGTEFPSAWFKEQGYYSASVTQKTYNGASIVSRTPIDIVSTTLLGDEADSHARFLEVVIENIRVVNIYLPNGNPVGTAKFDYKLSRMERLTQQMKVWLTSDTPTVIGGDFNVIPEDIDCHKPASWIRDALFQPEPRARYREMLELGYIDASGRCIRGWGVSSRSGTISGKPLNTTAASELTTFCLLRVWSGDSKAVKSIKGRECWRNPQNIPLSC